MLHFNKCAFKKKKSFPYFALKHCVYVDVTLMQTVERESESGGNLGELDSYEIEGGETKGEILQNLAEFQFSCVSFL